jgi:hypothetical protein
MADKNTLRQALTSARHHQREAVAFLAHGDFAPARAHAAVALAAAVIAALEQMDDDDDA